jgi:signal transduction histidine kinase
MPPAGPARTHVRASALGRAAGYVGLSAVFVAALVFQASRVAASWGDGYWQFGCAAGAVVCLIALVRRRGRTTAAIAGLAVAVTAILAARFAHLPAEPGLAMALALAVLVASAVRALPAVRACAIAAGGLAVVVGSLLAVLTSSSSLVAPMFNGAALLTAVACGLWPRLRDARRRAMAENVRRAERVALARELHDVVAHHISGIVVQAQAAQLIARKRPEKLESALADIESAGSDALIAMRRVVGLLRDTEDAGPVTSAPEHLADLVSRFEARGPAVALRLPGTGPAWPPEVTSTVYRVVQESLTNITRHAPHAQSVTITVEDDPRGVTVEISNAAAPPDHATARAQHRGGHDSADAPPALGRPRGRYGSADAPPALGRPRGGYGLTEALPALKWTRGGYGLTGMRERVEALGGTLLAGPLPDAGWSVRATLPLTPRGPR